MNDTLHYKNYQATINFSVSDEVFYGNILDIDDLINFEGSSIQDLASSFEEAVDDSLDLCDDIQKIAG